MMMDKVELFVSAEEDVGLLVVRIPRHHWWSNMHTKFLIAPGSLFCATISEAICTHLLAAV